MGFEARSESTCDVVGMYRDEFEESERLTSAAVWCPNESQDEIINPPPREGEILQLWEPLTREEIGDVHAVQSDRFDIAVPEVVVLGDQ